MAKVRAAIGWRTLFLGLAVLALGSCGPEGWQSLWWSSEQLGQRLYERGDYEGAAQQFADPLRKGTALYRAERFEAALDQFARLDTPEAWFGRGNALAHLERYEEAVLAYQRALELRPGFPDAAANIEYLQPFLPLETEGGVMGTIGRDAAADDVVYDADADRLSEEGRDTDMEPGGLLSEEQVADLWLQQVDASPAAFLRSKFRYQADRGQEESP